MTRRILSPVLCLCVSTFAASPLLAQVGNFDSLNTYSSSLEAQLFEMGVLAAAADDAAPAVFVGGNYFDGRSKQETGRYRREFDGQSGYLGYGHGFGAWRVGVAASLYSNDTDVLEVNPGVPAPATGAVESDGWIAALFAAYDAGQFSFQVSGGIGRGDNEIERSSDLGPSFGNSFSEFDTYMGFLAATARARFAQGERLAWTPYATLGWAKVKSDALTETGGPDRRIIGDFDLSQTYLQLGVELATGAEWYAPVLHAGWWRDFEDEGMELSVSAANGTFLGTLPVPKGARSLFLGGIRFTGDFTETLRGTLGVNYATGEGARIVNVSAGLGWSF